MYIPGLTPEEFFQMYGDTLEPEVAKVIENLLADHRKQQDAYLVLLDKNEALEDENEVLLDENEALEDEVHILEAELRLAGKKYPASQRTEKSERNPN